MENEVTLKGYTSHRFCVAPMVRYTDRHFRYLLRLMSRRAMLYTEMYTAAGILATDKHLAQFNEAEHPVGLQIAGNHPAEMTEASVLVENLGYDEININVGCPSPKVSTGNFGVCLMTQPTVVADCVQAITDKVSIPVTVKCRIGVDENDSYQFFRDFVQTVAGAGCRTFIVHARKAWLNGLSPKANRTLPELKYEYVYRLKNEFPELNVLLNGGLQSPQSAYRHLADGIDGVMLGRAICNQPWLMTEVDVLYYGEDNALNRRQVLQAYLEYMERQMTAGVPFYPLARHLLNFYKQRHGAKRWRHCLTDRLRRASHPLRDLQQFINQFEQEENYYVVDELCTSARGCAIRN